MEFGQSRLPQHIGVFRCRAVKDVPVAIHLVSIDVTGEVLQVGAAGVEMELLRPFQQATVPTVRIDGSGQ